MGSGLMFDPHAYGDEIAGILAFDGNGERLMPLAGGTCNSADARRLRCWRGCISTFRVGMRRTAWRRISIPRREVTGTPWCTGRSPTRGTRGTGSGAWASTRPFPHCGRARQKSASRSGTTGIRWRSSTTAKRRENVRGRRKNKRRWRSSGRSGNCCSTGAPKRAGDDSGVRQGGQTRQRAIMWSWRKR